MSDYLEGHIKRDPVTGAVAIRTNQPETNPPGSFAIIQAWLVSTTFSGAHYLPTEAVIEWDDLFTPQPQPDPNLIVDQTPAG